MSLLPKGEGDAVGCGLAYVIKWFMNHDHTVGAAVDLDYSKLSEVNQSSLISPALLFVLFV